MNTATMIKRRIRGLKKAEGCVFCKMASGIERAKLARLHQGLQYRDSIYGDYLVCGYHAAIMDFDYNGEADLMQRRLREYLKKTRAERY